MTFSVAVHELGEQGHIPRNVDGLMGLHRHLTISEQCFYFSFQMQEMCYKNSSKEYREVKKIFSSIGDLSESKVEGCVCVKERKSRRERQREKQE